MSEKNKLLKSSEKISALWNSTKAGAVKMADQNDDGKFDFQDVSAVASNIGQGAKSKVASIKQNLEEKNRDLEKKSLQPIFAEDLDDVNFYMSKLVRITELDKKHKESEVCQGAIGYISSQKNLRVINLFTDKANEFGVSFYPDKSREIYYMDPSDSNKYIALDEYFNYLKVARVTELQKIAQDLGAKHFKVTYKEQQLSSSKKSIKVNARAKINECTNIDRTIESSDMDRVEIAGEASFPGHDPIKPTLKYLKQDPSILNLIDMRMDKNAPLSHQKFILKLSNSSGIKESDAVKIDAVLKAMRISGSTSVINEVKNEDRRYFEYEIDF